MSGIALHHNADLDGLLCGFLLQEAGYKTIGMDYGDVVPCDLREVEIIADLSLPTEQMFKWSDARKGNCHWIDHHQAKVSEVRSDSRWGGYHYMTENRGSCHDVYQAVCDYKFTDHKAIFPNVELAARYDVFDFDYFNDPDPLHHQLGWRALVKGDISLNAVKADPSKYIHKGIYIVTEYEKKADELVRDTVTNKMFGFEDVRFFQGKHTNPIVTLKYPDTLFIGVSQHPSGMYKYSMRCQNPPVPLHEVAKSQGTGGGHRCAASFLSARHFEHLINEEAN